MAKSAFFPENGPKPGGPYTPVIRAGDFIFVAGQVPVDPVTRQLAGETIEEQTERVIQNIAIMLEAAGASLADVVKVTAHLSTLANFERFNTVYSALFPEPRPVRTTVGSELGAGYLVEIDVIAYVGK